MDPDPTSIMEMPWQKIHLQTRVP